MICLIGAWFEPRSHVKYGDGIAISMHGLSGQKPKLITSTDVSTTRSDSEDN